MGRPRAFDEEHVVGSVARIVVERGYDAVSVDDIVRVSGLGRGSIYAAFGSKAGLIARALAHERHRLSADPAGLAPICSMILASTGAGDPAVAAELSRCLDSIAASDGDRERVLGAALLARRPLIAPEDREEA